MRKIEKLLLAAMLLFPVAFIVLLILKLTGVVAWSWWLITSPMWAMFILSLILLSALMWIATRKL